MNMKEAGKWLDELRQAVLSGKINSFTAYEEVFAEMENGDHNEEVEDLFYKFTQSEIK